MTAPFTASNGLIVHPGSYEAPVADLIDMRSAASRKGLDLRPGELQALVEYAATIGITAPEIATGTDEEDELDRVEALARQLHADSPSENTWDGLSLKMRVRWLNLAFTIDDENNPSEDKSA